MEELSWDTKGEKFRIKVEKRDDFHSKDIRFCIEGYVERRIDAVLKLARQFDYNVECEDTNWLIRHPQDLFEQCKLENGTSATGHRSRIVLVSQTQNYENASDLASGLIEFISKYRELIGELGMETDIAYFDEVSHMLYRACWTEVMKIFPERHVGYVRGYGVLPEWFVAFLEESD